MIITRKCQGNRSVAAEIKTHLKNLTGVTNSSLFYINGGRGEVLYRGESPYPPLEVRKGEERDMVNFFLVKIISIRARNSGIHKLNFKEIRKRRAS